MRPRGWNDIARAELLAAMAPFADYPGDAGLYEALALSTAETVQMAIEA